MRRLVRGFLDLLEVLIVLSILSLLVAIMIDRLRPKEPAWIELNPEKWTCAQKEMREFSYLEWIGRVPYNRQGVREECVLWRRTG